MLKRSPWILAVALTLAAAGCDKQPAPAEPVAEEPAAQAAVEEPAAEEKAEEKAEAEPEGEIGEAALAMVTVAAEGSTFDPAIEPEQLPAGSWYCDMGTVHYARGAQGDGKCTECGMALKQYDPEAHAALKEKAVEAQPEGHDGHDHGDHGDHDGHDHGEHAGHDHGEHAGHDHAH